MSGQRRLSKWHPVPLLCYPFFRNVYFLFYCMLSVPFRVSELRLIRPPHKHTQNISWDFHSRQFKESTENVTKNKNKKATPSEQIRKAELRCLECGELEQQSLLLTSFWCLGLTCCCNIPKKLSFVLL